MTDFPLWHCLRPETQKKLIKAGWKAVKEKPVEKVVIPTTEIEELPELSRLMAETPKNIKRESRW